MLLFPSESLVFSFKNVETFRNFVQTKTCQNIKSANGDTFFKVHTPHFVFILFSFFRTFFLFIKPIYISIILYVDYIFVTCVLRAYINFQVVQWTSMACKYKRSGGKWERICYYAWRTSHRVFSSRGIPVDHLLREQHSHLEEGRIKARINRKPLEDKNEK